MDNYKDCSYDDFKNAMDHYSKDKVLSNFTDNELFIILTKYEADKLQLLYARTSYTSELAYKCTDTIRNIEHELKIRGKL